MPIPTPPSPPLNPQIWRACAGPKSRIPAAGSRVYYFPQGHAEHSSRSPDFSSIPRRRPMIVCSVAAITFLADTATDEVFAKILLDPRSPPLSSPPPPAILPNVNSFAKILTPSDANNGGGFSVPRYCADSIFPPLDFASSDTPVQTLSIRDVHGTVWPFRHIYRGTPRRHLLTTGWSGLVNSKKLVAGDSVVFVLDGAGELFVGVRRAVRAGACSAGYLRYAAGAGAKLEEEELRPGEGSSRNVKGRVSPESVVEAVRLAEMNRPFEVVYYPRSRSLDFLVSAEAVEAAAKVVWTAGMRVKMSVDTEDTTRNAWLQGTVSGTALHDPGLWPGSPWRMLQVTWDEPKVLQNVKSLNPWQVELASTTPYMQESFMSMKRLKASPTFELPNNIECNKYLSMTSFGSTMMESRTPYLFKHNTFPVGIQGARHISSCESNSLCESTHNHSNDKMSEKAIDVSTELSIGGISQSDSLSPQIQSTPNHFGDSSSNSSRKIKGSFQLFGKIIQTDISFDYDAFKENKEVEAEGRPLFFPYYTKQLHEGLDIQCKKVSVLEAPSM